MIDWRDMVFLLKIIAKPPRIAALIVGLMALMY
jgi:hypothetical protein